MTVELLVGTYAEKGGAGLIPLRYDAGTDTWSLGEPIAHVRNASFGVLAGSRAILVDEADGQVGLFDRADGHRPLGQVPSGGEAPCHVALDPSRRWAAIACYESGSVGLFRLDGDTIDGPVALHRNEGSGPDTERQEGPHAHWVGFSADGAHLLCVDLGADRIFRLHFDPQSGAITRADAVYEASPGSGPRHLAFHPELPIAYLASELAATLTVLHAETGGFRAGTVIPLPGDSQTLSGAIATDAAGTLLYATSRGHDSIATFALDPTGEPTLLDVTPSGGASPRHLLLLPDHLVVANEEGGNVGVFRLDDQGRPTEPSVLPVPGAAFITFGEVRDTR